jgi:hypothetical protein
MTRPRIAILCGTLLAALALTFAAASTATVAAPKICPTIFEPVCAVDREGKPQTFNNACEATRARGRILHTGKCFGQICALFRQVCARVPGHRPRTFASECLAEQAEPTVLHDGPCK